MGFLLLLKGIIVGFLASIPLGPIGVLVIQRTLGKGRTSGLVSGVGAACADSMLAIIAGLGLSFIIDFIKTYETSFQFFGGLLVVAVGLRIFFKNPIDQVRERKLQKSNLTTDFLSVFILTLSNPVAVFLFVAFFAGLNLLQGDPNLFLHTVLILGVFAGGLIWWFILTSLVNYHRAKFRLRRLWWMNKITGVLIVLFGVFAVFSVIWLFVFRSNAVVSDISVIYEPFRFVF